MIIDPSRLTEGAPLGELFDPYGKVIEELRELLEPALSEVGGSFDEVSVGRPPSRELGDISVSLFALARRLSADPDELCREVLRRVEFRSDGLLVAGDAVRGFLNFRLNRPKYFSMILEAVRSIRERYGYNPAERPLRVLVEHTSVTPVKPIHVGHLRNALLGDSLARLLRFRGHEVSTHFYVNDVGLQVAYAAYAYSKARDLEPRAKADHWIGAMYTVMNALTEVIELRRRYEEAKQRDPDQAMSLLRRIDEWMSVLANFKERYPELVERLLSAVEGEDPMEEIHRLNRGYERGELRAVRLVREVSQRCLEGYRETLERLGISFDSWDWESDLTVWSDLVYEVVERLRRTGYVAREDGALVLLADQAVRDLALHEALGLPRGHEVPRFVIVRSDGTTLYVTRDVAYAMWKLRRADLVINVIGVEQTLEQLQVKVALCLLGMREDVRRMVHYAYEVVNIVGGRLSGRRGRYITADELIDEAVRRARREIESRSRGMSESEAARIAEIVGVGAVKYAFLSVSPSRPLSFDWSRVLDFSRNSGPFIQYAYTRARSILRKSGVEDPLAEDVDASLLREELEVELMEAIGEFPHVVAKAADDLRVDAIAGFANRIATIFNSFYDRHSVLSAKPEELRAARLAMTYAFCIALRNALHILGIEAPERM